METVNINNVNSDQETTRKRNRKKNKVSNLHQRLCPNFDLRDILKPKENHPNENTDLQSPKQEELDPKTMDFATLVTCLHPTFILDYLRKVLNFLRSNHSEMSFSKIAPYKEEFLVRIARDNKHLTCTLFCAESRIAVEDILVVLHQNRYRFKWVYVYKGGENVGK